MHGCPIRFAEQKAFIDHVISGWSFIQPLLAMLRKVGQDNFQSTEESGPGLEESGPWPELSPDEFGSCSLERSANWRQCLPHCLPN